MQQPITWGGVPYSATGYYDESLKLATKSDMAVVGIPYEGGQSSHTGQSGAPFAIRRYEHFDSWMAHDLGSLLTVKAVDCGDVEISRSHALQDLYEADSWFNGIQAHTDCPVVLGGDHSVSAWVLRHQFLKHRGTEIDLVHFDAHTDTWSYEGSEFPGHESWVRWVMDRALVAKVFQFGVRAMGPDDHADVYPTQLRTNHGSSQSNGIKEFVQYHDRNRPNRKIHLSIDLDVVDPAMCPGVAYPEPGGWLPGVLLRAVESIVATGRVIGVDITEMTPSLDRTEMSVRLAHRCVLAVRRGIKRTQMTGGAV